MSSTIRPYQDEFVTNFLQGDYGKNVLLVHHAGMGASFTAIEVVKRHVHSNPSARVLILAASAMIDQWHFQLIDAGLRHDLIDRYRYREMQDAMFEHRTMWFNASPVVLVRTRFDHSEDILESVIDGSWTLIVSVDSHRLIRQDSQLLRKIQLSSPKAQFLLLSPFSDPHLTHLFEMPFHVIRWDWKDIATKTSEQGKDSIMLQVGFIRYSPYPAEIELRQRLNELRSSSGLPSIPYLNFATLSNALNSSPAAFEEVLGRLRNRLAHNISHPNELYLGSEPVPDLDVHSMRRWEWITFSEKFLELLDSLHVDSKWDTLARAIMDDAPPSNSSSVYIIAEFKATVLYLQSRLEELGFGSVSFGGHHTALSMYDSYTSEMKQSGFYLATNAILNDRLDFSFIKRVIFYDYPRNEMTLHRTLSQLGLTGYRKRIKMDIVVDTYDYRAESRARRHIETVASQWGLDLSMEGGNQLNIFKPY